MATKNLTERKAFVLTQKLQDILNAYPTINKGGCGLFAKELGMILQDKGYKVEVIILFAYRHCREDGNNFISNNQLTKLYESYYSWTHVMLLVNGKYYIDSSGVYKDFKGWLDANRVIHRHRSRPFDLGFLNEFISDDYADKWASQFDRGLMGEIKNKLKKSLEIFG